MGDTILPRNGLGLEVRDRRNKLGLSVRALAERAGISPAYVTAIETGRNPSTGRPPVLSVPVMSQLAAALQLDMQRLVNASHTLPRRSTRSEHVLLYSFDAASGSLLSTIDELFGGDVDHWLYIADPRYEVPEQTARATICRWDFGFHPYETTQLDPDKLLDALEAEVEAVAASHAGRRVGIAITDCSAVMRYVQNAAAEVGLERTWHEHVHRIWTAHLGAPPPVDVCAYRSEDIETLGLTIDQLGIALELICHHHRVVALAAKREVTDGAPAIYRILERACPIGTNPTSWSELADAASRTFAASAARA